MFPTLIYDFFRLRTVSSSVSLCLLLSCGWLHCDWLRGVLGAAPSIVRQSDQRTVVALGLVVWNPSHNIFFTQRVNISTRFNPPSNHTVTVMCRWYSGVDLAWAAYRQDHKYGRVTGSERGFRRIFTKVTNSFLELGHAGTRKSFCGLVLWISNVQTHLCNPRSKRDIDQVDISLAFRWLSLIPCWL